MLERHTLDRRRRVAEADMPTNGPSVARRRLARIGMIVALILFATSLIMQAIDIYQAHRAISPVHFAALALAALAIVMGAGAYFYTVSRKN
jgi:uncharacterized membrane protein YcjF (UPF0283 family)